jgi:hypothetical protein
MCAAQINQNKQLEQNMKYTSYHSIFDIFMRKNQKNEPSQAHSFQIHPTHSPQNLLKRKTLLCFWISETEEKLKKKNHKCCFVFFRKKLNISKRIEVRFRWPTSQNRTKELKWDLSRWTPIKKWWERERERTTLPGTGSPGGPPALARHTQVSPLIATPPSVPIPNLCSSRQNCKKENEKK